MGVSVEDAESDRRVANRKFPLMRNRSQTHPGGGLRGFQLHLGKKRGVFWMMDFCHCGPGRSIPASPLYSEPNASEADVAEIDYRCEALKPYLKLGSSDFTPVPCATIPPR